MSNFEKMQARLAAGETVLIDGGMGSEFERRGISSPKVWSGGPMITHPEVVREVHEEYIKAGAEVIITNSFSTGRDMLAVGGLEHKVAEANKMAIDMAVQARRNAGAEDSVVVAASVSTMSPKLEAGIPVPYEKALETYREQLGELAKGGPDVVVGEMLIRISDALAVIDVAKELGLPVWIGYSVVPDEGELCLGIEGKSGGVTLQEAMDAIKDKDIDAVFVMHTSVGETGPGLEIVKKNWSGTFGAYAHFPDPGGPRSSVPSGLNPAQYLEYAKEWRGQGASIIGGCCGTTPDHIQALKEWLSGS